MLMLPFLRGLSALLSLAILASAVYLLATWASGETHFVDGVAAIEHDEWRLWWALGLGAWSFAGRYLVLSLLARPGGPQFARADNHAALEAAGGARIHTETAGRADRPTLVLTHGWGMDASIWTPIRQALADRFRIVLWDLPGLGRSRPTPLSAIDMSAFADDLKRVSQGAGGPAILVGHSIGGMIIQTLARDHPELFQDRVAGAVLLNTTHTNPLRTMIFAPLMRAAQPLLEFGSRLTIWFAPVAQALAWLSYLNGNTHLVMRLGHGARTTRRSLDHASRLTTRNPAGVQAKGNLAMFAWDATGALASVATPVLVLGGEIDIVTKPEAGRAIAASAPNGRYVGLPDANHMSLTDQADVYAREIAAFAEAVQSR